MMIHKAALSEKKGKIVEKWRDDKIGSGINISMDSIKQLQAILL